MMSASTKLQKSIITQVQNKDFLLYFPKMYTFFGLGSIVKELFTFDWGKTSNTSKRGK